MRSRQPPKRTDRRQNQRQFKQPRMPLPPGPMGPRSKYEDEMDTLKKENERRERILADRLRTAAKWRAKIPEVRKVNFENFKNRYQDVHEPDYAIEVLMDTPSLQAQIRREQGYRRREQMARARQAYLNIRNPALAAHEKKKIASSSEKAKRSDKKNDSAGQQADAEIQRIRIQSQPVLGHLTSLLNDMDSRSTPRTFMRPFKPLVYFQPKMKEILATLEEKWGDYEEVEEAASVESEDIEVVPVTDSDNNSGEDKEAEDGEESDREDDTESLRSVDSNADEDFENLMDSPEALRDMRCYVDFVDDEVMPLYTQYDDGDTEKVKFDDLWSLFRVGDLIYMPAAGEVGGRYHEVWRIYRVETPEPKIEYPTSGWDFFFNEPDTSEEKSFTISAYYIDHDGVSYGAVRRKFNIDAFVGERQINSLEVFPVRYCDKPGELITSLQAQGRNFGKYLEDRHQQYNAWTLTRNPPDNDTDPESEILESQDYQKMRHPEFVESDVIVDLTEAYQKMPDWRPPFHKVTLNKSLRCSSEEDELPIQQWFDGGSRQTLAYQQDEIVQKADGIELRQRRENLNADAFLRTRAQGSRTYEANPKALELRDEDLALLPKRMFAYSLRERRFMAIDLNLLKPVRREAGVFESLRIHDDYKDVVRGLVTSHFQRKKLERRYAASATEGPGQDLIQGKGRGLVVLLHGVPGVGKTATAEAVAMENHKPLFVITCGDLGLTPNDVETSLKNVFRLAHLWDCVLLLDEADVFLSQRSKLDMKRNALVSVFLRVLEYYNGLLFLTTNRVGTIDEAFKSRIHLSLYYPPLDKAQTRDIFRLNIAKLKEVESERQRMTGEPAIVVKESEVLDFAAKHYEELARSTGCWNGRQIRSAFQVASSLAVHNYNAQAELARGRGQLPPKAPLLDRVLFEKVQMSTQSFDRHMRKESALYDEDLPLRGTFNE